MLEINVVTDQLIITDKDGAISGRHLSQLNFWGFQSHSESRCLMAVPSNIQETLDKLLAYFSRHNIPYVLQTDAANLRKEFSSIRDELQQALQQGFAVKNGDVKKARPKGFYDFLKSNIFRKLKDHQLKSVLHLLAVGNGANFSVPGSGKTTVVLVAYSWLKQLGLVDALFVVGPPSCFGPWQNEFREVLHSEPTIAFLAGGSIEERRSKYLANKSTVCDLYLTSFQTLQRDYEQARRLFEERGLRFFFVVDEAHYIKQLDGAWATAVLNLAQFAHRRCVLTGTPFPRTYSDAFNIFHVLWPHCPPINPSDKTKIQVFSQTKNDKAAIDLLQKRIGPLFYRVRKSDLHLAPQEFHPPITIKMAKYEKLIYDAILDRVKELSKKDYMRDFDLVMRLRRGRMMRLRQGISYAKLLNSAVVEYKEDLIEGDLSLADIITHYDDLEKPGKLETLAELVGSLRRHGEKVLIWSNFVQSLKLIKRRLDNDGHGTRLIFGETPTENSSFNEELTRERFIAEFANPKSGIDILIANPAACAESISLHKSCSHAVYYDLSYNCAQYLQSLDRIHRVGGSENKSAHYHFLQYADSIDSDILANLNRKAQVMGAIIDQEYPIYSLDMFAIDEELEAYERIFKQ